jgi:hypothetical protein
VSAIAAPADAPTVLVTAVGGAEGARAAAAALASASADVERAALLVDVGGRSPRPTLLAAVAAQRLEERLAAQLPQARIAARGQVCQIAVAASPAGLETAAAAVTVARGAIAVLHLPPEQLQPALAGAAGLRPTGVLLRADLAAERPLLSLLVRDLLARGLAVAVLKHRLNWIAERRALFGALPPDASVGLPKAVLRQLLRDTRPAFPIPGMENAGRV